MYPKYRIVEMTDGTYVVQWRMFYLHWYSNLSSPLKSLKDAKDYLAWSMDHDRQKRARKKNRIKRILPIEEIS